MTELMTDTLAIELTKDTLQLTVDLAVKAIPQSQDEALIGKEWITVIGMTLVAILTIVSQHLLTRRTTKSDFDKIKTQIESDFLAKSRLEWIASFRNIISQLLTVVDPDFRGELNGKKMAGLIFQAQLMLDDTLADEKKLGSSLSKLGDYAVKVEIGNLMSEKALLDVQAEIQDFTKAILKRKQFPNENK